MSHLQARRREGMRQRTAPTEKAAGEAGSGVGGGQVTVQLTKGVRDVQSGGQDLGKTMSS